MSHKVLDSAATAVFCDSVASMIGAGMQVDESLLLLCENRAPSQLQEACSDTYDLVSSGYPLSEAMAESEWFPKYATDMVVAGESAGRVDETLAGLAAYYGEESRILAKLRESVSRPLAMLLLTTAILAVMTFAVMPTFSRSYTNMSSVLSIDAGGSIQVATVIGVVALVLSSVCSLVALWLWVGSRGGDGGKFLIRTLSKIPLTAPAMRQIALSKFTAALATYVAAGATGEEAMHQSMGAIDDPALGEVVERAYQDMTRADSPRSFGQAVEENGVFEPLYARMLNVGIKAGRIDEVLMEFAEMFRQDAASQLDSLVDGAEPVLATFMTLSAGVAMIAVMLPLVGMMVAMG